MSLRTKVLSLLSGLLLFLVAAAGASLVVRARAAEELARVTQHDVPLLTLATEVTAAHLEQAIRLERAFRHSRDADPEARAAYREARDEYEAYAGEIWHRLQEARELTRAAETGGDPAAATQLAGIERIDAAHNRYAANVREAFSYLESGDRVRARARTRLADDDEEQLEHALGVLLSGAASSAGRASTTAQQEERSARAIVAGLLALGLATAAAVFAVVVGLVSEVRTLSGLLPICAQCKRIRDDRGYWNQLEAYLAHHSDAQFTHGMCVDCKEAMFDDIRRSRAAGSTEAGAGAPL